MFSLPQGFDEFIRYEQIHLSKLTKNKLYRVSHKKRNCGFAVACDLKVPYLFTSSNQATPAEENDTKIIKFDWVILIRVNKRNTFNGIPQSIIMKGYSRHNSSLIGRKNRAKFENDCISRNGHRMKTTQPNLMILVTFSSAEDVWSNDVIKYNTFSSQGT